MKKIEISLFIASKIPTFLFFGGYEDILNASKSQKPKALEWNEAYKVLCVYFHSRTNVCNWTQNMAMYYYS